MCEAQWPIFKLDYLFLWLLGFFFNLSKILYCENSQFCDVELSSHSILFFLMLQQNIEIWTTRPGIFLEPSVGICVVSWNWLPPIKWVIPKLIISNSGSDNAKTKIGWFVLRHVRNSTGLSLDHFLPVFAANVLEFFKSQKNHCIPFVTWESSFVYTPVHIFSFSKGAVRLGWTHNIHFHLILTKNM